MFRQLPVYSEHFFGARRSGASVKIVWIFNQIDLSNKTDCWKNREGQPEKKNEKNITDAIIDI